MHCGTKGITKNIANIHIYIYIYIYIYRNIYKYIQRYTRNAENTRQPRPGLAPRRGPRLRKKKTPNKSGSQGKEFFAGHVVRFKAVIPKTKFDFTDELQTQFRLGVVSKLASLSVESGQVAMQILSQSSQVLVCIHSLAGFEMASQVVEVLTHSADNFVDNKIFGLVALSDIAAYFEFSEDDRTHLRKQFDDVKSEDDADLNEKQFRKLVCHLCYEENFKSPRGDGLVTGFEVADIGKNQALNFDQWMEFWAKVKRGEVAGIGEKGTYDVPNDSPPSTPRGNSTDECELVHDIFTSDDMRRSVPATVIVKACYFEFATKSSTKPLNLILRVG